MEYGKFTHEEAVYAVDNCGVDWILIQSRRTFMFCTKCGKQVEGQFRFCPNCGKEIKPINNQLDNGSKIGVGIKKKNNKSLPYLFLKIGIFILLILELAIFKHKLFNKIIFTSIFSITTILQIIILLFPVIIIALLILLLRKK